MLAQNKSGIVCCGYLLFTLVALGIPWRWDKFRGGTEVEWIGYWADLWRSQLGMSAKRAERLIRWMDSQVAAGTTDLADFAAALGRL